MCEFSNPDTNKPLHVGHLRNDCLGESISRILAGFAAKEHMTGYRAAVDRRRCRKGEPNRLGTLNTVCIGKPGLELDEIGRVRVQRVLRLQDKRVLLPAGLANDDPRVRGHKTFEAGFRHRLIELHHNVGLRIDTGRSARRHRRENAWWFIVGPATGWGFLYGTR